MDNKHQTHQKTGGRPNWRDYQASLKQSAANKRPARTLLKTALLFLLLPALVYGIIDRIGQNQETYTSAREHPTSGERADTHDADETLFDKRDIRNLLDKSTFINLRDKSFDFDINGQRFRVDTSLDIPLQNFVIKKMDPSTSRYIAIVAIDPSTGKILSMAGFDKSNPTGNPCVDYIFPAASVFKIVTAAAAIEKCGLNPKSKLAYNGSKHTLYKSQLKDQTNKYTNRITFKDSFAQSVNPVFGKIGTLYLGKPVLEAYASSFGFNRKIEFELPVPASFFSISDEPYEWAEIASGFNRTTTITPLHGALIASTLLNQGRLIEPTIVDQIVDDKGQPVYRSRSAAAHQVITPRASDFLNDLMEETIRTGTSKKAFKGFQRDRTLSRLDIGGKTGSIYNETHDSRYDWFVGFAKEKKGSKEIALSVFVAHEKYIGIRSSSYARMIIKHYFQNHFAKTQDKAVAGKRS
ncbi:penicillin-binding transpeptidase domain-containing protein [Thermodesulfobacteriota bacterium]